ncbi:hypothetical protein BC834DRAFT_224345 [Gloeopeniophorella convolvens]|nr:hypothetical protein BC834DRAFT_224345 [Gloeopeniophorella convolvens]
MAKSKSGKTRVSSAAVKEIPSSVPEQDHRATRTPTPARAGSRQKGKAREVAMPPRAVATPEPKSTGSHPSMHDEDVIMQDTHPDNVTASYDEETTEPADDLPMEDAPQRSKASSSRKRPASPRKAVYKTAVRATSGTPSLASSARAAKRAKNHHTAATRVFALWKQDAAYFSGVVYERGSAADRFKIQFDDGDEDMVDVKNMRRLELHVDDRVSIVESQDKAVIVNADAQERGTVLVQLLDDDAASEFEVAVTAIKIQSRAVTSQWRDRVITAEELVPLLAPAAAVKTETPTSLRASGASLARKALAHVGVVVTFSAGCNREKEREDMVRIIKTSGGTCLDDWSDVWPLSGEYGAGRKRWVVGEQSVGTALQQEVQQVFLVSDAANSKPRYLTALALGIPCLSVDWLKALSSSKCIVADWPQYLLPAGYSDSLGARVTQLVDFDWGKTLDHLTDVMSNSVPTKLFAGQSVLVVGQEYFPPPAKGKKGSSGVGDEKSEGGRFVPRIILSMGAARVETVPDAKHASGKKFDYVIVKDLHERPADIAGTYVSMEWVKDCLIAGRLFPPP